MSEKTNHMSQMSCNFRANQKSWLNKGKLGAAVLALAVTIFVPRAKAQEAKPPEELASVVEKLEKAANDRNIKRVMRYYGEDFTNQDGLTADGVRTALEQMWSNYSQLTYDTEILSWSEEGEEMVAETATTIVGEKESEGRTIRLESDLKSRQYFRDGKLVRQEILTEQTKITSGDRPPEVTVNAPETVKLGDKYAFDTIVTEPLEGNILLGAAIEEKTASSLYLDPTSIELEPLTAGGIYKVVTAPRFEDNHWLSAIVVRGDGITMVTQRVRVEE